MRLQEVLNKFSNNDFLITVDGWCDELSFCEYEEEKKMNYWKKYKDKKIKSMSLLITNNMPELCIEIEELTETEIQEKDGRVRENGNKNRLQSV